MKFLRKIDSYFTRIFIKINKRIRFVGSAGILSLLMLFSTFFFFDKAPIFIAILVVVSYFLTYISILEGIKRVEWIMLFLMPVIFTVVFYVFYFLFPVRWLTRLPFIMIYGFIMYAILLTSNIFNVGVEKSLQLYRAAFSVNYFLQSLIVFLVMNVIFSFRVIFFVNGLLVFAIVFPIALQLFWSVKPKISFDNKDLLFAFLVSFVMMQVAMILSFAPMKPYIFALALTAIYYSLAGLIYHFLDEKLFKQTLREYIVVLVFVSLIVALSIQW